jgi:hypothetical protein
MCFSLTAITVWLGWVALHFGWPAQISRNIARQTTGYQPEISWVAFALAVGFTVGWIALVVWRLRVRPQALWRGTVLSAGGLTVTWILLVLLWQPAVDYARSYRTVSGQLAQALQQNVRPGECVRGLSLGSGQRASFLIFNNLTFTFDSKCTLVLQQTSNQSLRDNTAAYSDGCGKAAGAPTARKSSACSESAPPDDARARRADEFRRHPARHRQAGLAGAGQPMGRHLLRRARHRHDRPFQRRRPGGNGAVRVDLHHHLRRTDGRGARPDPHPGPALRRRQQS